MMTDYSFDRRARLLPMLKDLHKGRNFAQTVYFAPYRVLERVLP